MTADTYTPRAGDVGEEERQTKEFEPIPETAPVHEPSPEVAPAEPVPA